MRKKRGYYIHYNARDIIGVSKKIDAHLAELLKYYDVEEIDIKIKNKSILRNMFAVLPFISIDWDYSEAYETISNPDFLYIRSGGDDYRFYKFLKFIRKCYPKCKIIVEIPTYPFIRESIRSIQGLVLLPKALFNCYYRNKRYIDRYVTYTDLDYIMGIKTIKTINGINVESIKPALSNNDVEKSVVNMLAVATLQPAHGYERVIKGLYEYYNNEHEKEIYFHIVGEGKEKEYYKQLVKKYSLEDYVIFHGLKAGRELDQLYDSTDIALNSFGDYKVNVHISSALKVREALAKGLPIATGILEDIFIENADYKYYIQFPNDPSFVDICEIVRFLEKIHKEKTNEEVRNIIRRFAMEKIDMSVSMARIEKYIEN